ncbi:hypothetical protein [Embleya sp. NPDC050493]|uniref:hypothetical protein n=1 Tax=Embleya sp. NPDC050493 TaxID=3363989 RepID=UPI00379DD9D2
MSDRLTAVRVLETNDPGQPVQLQLQVNWDEPDGRDFDVTLTQLWELHAHIGARLARYPAPSLTAGDSR